ncbi:MAG: bifunctional 4-hydroxy-2-oxoglutarate aldolase/2-dehydro-3-deoxy-phosphogluconate aldolase [Bacillota bacterium]
MTPTEAVQAYLAGADIIRVFPGGALGANYIKDLQGPQGNIPLMPSGGVSVNNVETFIKNGSVAVGVGGSLINEHVIAEGHYDNLTKNAQEFVEKIRKARV